MDDHDLISLIYKKLCFYKKERTRNPKREREREVDSEREEKRGGVRSRRGREETF